MDEQIIKAKLDQLANYQAERDALALQKQELIDGVLTAEIKAKLADIDAEFASKSGLVGEIIVNLEADIKQAVVELGASVKATFLHAVWNKGRVSWDTRGLDGFLVAHPEIGAFRKEGEPTVSLRTVKG